MRVGVIGAGSVGTVLAAVLAQAGHEVHLTARGDALAVLVRGGVAMRGALGTAQGPVRAVPTLEPGLDVVFVCTKAQDAHEAIALNAEALHAIPVVVVQNGLGGLDILRALVPDADGVGALALFAASLEEPGSVLVTGPGRIYLGSDADGSSAALQHVASLLDPLLLLEVVPDFLGAQWTKLTVNELNAVPAITGLSMQESVAHPGLRAVTTAAMRECVRTGLARGIRFGTLQGLDHVTLCAFARMPLLSGGVVPLRLVRAMGAVPNPGSTLQSLRRGKKTEIDYLHGAVVRAAREAGEHAPVNELLVGLVHEVEAGSGFFMAEEVVREYRTVASCSQSYSSSSS